MKKLFILSFTIFLTFELFAWRTSADAIKRIVFGDIQIDDPLASFRTPYKFYLGDTFSIAVPPGN